MKTLLAMIVLGLSLSVMGADKDKELPFGIKPLKALAEGDASAKFIIGLMYAYGEGAPEDDKEAVKWFRKAAELGHADAQFKLGDMYANGQGVELNSMEAVKWFRKAAEQGLADAQYNLGVMYWRCDGLEPRERVSGEVATVCLCLVHNCCC